MACRLFDSKSFIIQDNPHDPRKVIKLTIVSCPAIWYRAQQQRWRLACNVCKICKSKRHSIIQFILTSFHVNWNTISPIHRVFDKVARLTVGYWHDIDLTWSRHQIYIKQLCILLVLDWWRHENREEWVLDSRKKWGSYTLLDYTKMAYLIVIKFTHTHTPHTQGNWKKVATKVITFNTMCETMGVCHAPHIGVAGEIRDAGERRLFAALGRSSSL